MKAVEIKKTGGTEVLEIKDITLRVKLETRNLLLGRELILFSDSIKEISDLTSLALKFNERNIL